MSSRPSLLASLSQSLSPRHVARLNGFARLVPPPCVARAASTATSTAGNAAQARAAALELSRRIEQHFGQASQLNDLRAAFLPPSRSTNRVDPRVRSQPGPANDPAHLPHSQRKIIAKHFDHCCCRADYVRLVQSILAQTHMPFAFRAEAARLVCDGVYNKVFWHLPESVRGYDKRQLYLAHQLRFQLEDSGLPLPQSLLALGLLSAATCRNFPALKLYLYEQRKSDMPMSPRLFSDLLDLVTTARDDPKSTWDEDRTLTVLLGFPDAAADEPYDLSSFLRRDDWWSLEHFLRVTSRLRCVHQLRFEWALWLENRLRTTSDPCNSVPQTIIAKPDQLQAPSTRLRGDVVFLEAFYRTGAIKEAWMVLKESRIPFAALEPQVQTDLLRHPEFAPPEVWTDEMRHILLQRYADELAKIEAVYGVEWVWDEQQGKGYHRLSEGSFLANEDDLDAGARIT